VWIRSPGRPPEIIRSRTLELGARKASIRDQVLSIRWVEIMAATTAD
jgi:hypothetical protein